jgi:hypothetical protein
MATQLENEMAQIDALMTEEDSRFLRLAQLLNEAVLYDFDNVVRLLYRVDVFEKKLKAALAESATDAGTVIARLLLEREKEKVESRKKYRQPDEDIPEDDRW